MEILSYGVKLVDQMSGPSKEAAQSLDKVSKSLTKAKADLATYQAQLARAKTIGDIEGYRKFTKLTDEARKSVFGLTNEFEQLKPAGEASAKATAEFAESAEMMLGVAGAAAGAALALAGAFAALTVKGAALAIEQVELRDELETMFEALGDGPGAGKATLSMLDELSNELPQSRAQLAEWTKQYEALGITDLAGIRYQLQATASAQAIMGEQGAAAYENLQKKIQEAIETHHGLKMADKGLANLSATGANVRDVAEEMGVSVEELRKELKQGTVDAQKFGDALSQAIIKKGAGPLQNMAGDLGTIVDKAHERFNKLFDGADPKPFTEGLRDTLSVLDESKPSAQALKFAITSFFNEVFALAGKVGPVLKHTFLELEIGALKMYIAFKPTIREFQKFTDAGDGLKMFETNLLVTVKLMTLLAEQTALVVNLVTKVAGANLRVASFGALGDSAGTGFADGMKKSKAADAGEEIAAESLKATSKKLEVRSPSRAMMRLGSLTAEGYAQGAQEGLPRVRASGTALADTMLSESAYAPASAAAGGPGGAAAGGRQMVVYVGGVNIVGAQAGTAYELTELAMAELLERLALKEGLLAP